MTLYFLAVMIPFALTACAGIANKTYELDSAAQDGSFHLQDDRVMESLQQRVDESSFRLQINSNPVIDSETMKGNLMVSNPAENQNDLYVDIYLEESEECIYQSKRLMPGERVVYDTLLNQLLPGTYEAIAVFSLLGEGSEDVIGQMEAVLQIDVIENRIIE